MRDADQFHVGEHHARTLFTVIQQHFDALGAQVGVQLFGQRLHAVRLVHVHRQDRNLERRDGVRPDDAALVVVLLDGGGHHARDPDAVAAHGQDLVTAIFALHGRFHRFRVLGAELEDVAHFDAALDQQRALTVRAGVAFDHVTDVGHLRQRQVAIPVDAEVVFAVDVGTGGEVAHRGYGAVSNHRHRQVDRAQ